MSNGNGAKLRPDPQNARKHPDRNRAMIRQSLEEVGAFRSIAVDGEGIIRAGNGVYEQAQALGLKVRIVQSAPDELIAVQRPDLVGEKAVASALYDNRASDLAEWDAEQLAAFRTDGMALDRYFTEDELAKLLPRKGGLKAGADADVVPESAPQRCRSGDLWQMGVHRLLVGDSTNAEDVARLMDGKRAALCLTDPPYGVGWKYESTDDTEDNLQRLIDGFLPLARSVADVVLLTSGNRNQSLYPRPDWTLAWFVPAGAASGPWGFTCWQPVLAYGKDPYLQAAKGSRPDALCMTESSPKLDHPCPKPVGVWKWFLERGSCGTGAEERIFDPFLGSGTTLIAAESLGRSCYGIEIEPLYADLCLQRFLDATGAEPELLERTAQETE